MNIKEAIEIINSECYVFNPLNFDRTTKINSALDMAIDILEEIEKCDEKSATKCFTCINEIKGRYCNGTKM